MSYLHKISKGQKQSNILETGWPEWPMQGDQFQHNRPTTWIKGNTESMFVKQVIIIWKLFSTNNHKRGNVCTLGNHNTKSPKPVRVTRGTTLRGLRNLQYQSIYLYILEHMNFSTTKLWMISSKKSYTQFLPCKNTPDPKKPNHGLNKRSNYQSTLYSSNGLLEPLKSLTKNQLTLVTCINHSITKKHFNEKINKHLYIIYKLYIH
jgi:hypothetical protein